MKMTTPATSGGSTTVGRPKDRETAAWTCSWDGPVDGAPNRVRFDDAAQMIRAAEQLRARRASTDVDDGLRIVLYLDESELLDLAAEDLQALHTLARLGRPADVVVVVSCLEPTLTPSNHAPTAE